MSKKIIYTHDIAAGIVDKFEDVLVENNISVPSPDDDDRSDEDKLGLYGLTYHRLVEDVEAELVELIAKARNSNEDAYDVISDVYGGCKYDE